MNRPRLIFPIWRRLALMLVCLGAARATPVRAAPRPVEGERGPRTDKRAGFTRLRQIVRGEPSAKEVQQATLRYYKLEPQRIHRMARAANLKGLLPEVEAGFDNLIGHSFTNTKDGLYPTLPSPPDNPNPLSYKERASTNTDQLLWRVRAVWSLDRLVFNPEELDVKSLNSIEENLVREVTTLYYSRRRQLASLILSPPEDDEALYYEQLRLDEMTSTLDALSGGMFGKRAYHADMLDR